MVVSKKDGYEHFMFPNIFAIYPFIYQSMETKIRPLESAGQGLSGGNFARLLEHF